MPKGDSLSHNKQNPSSERHNASWEFPTPCEENTRKHQRKCEKANLDDRSECRRETLSATINRTHPASDIMPPGSSQRHARRIPESTSVSARKPIWMTDRNAEGRLSQPQ